jgi:hypothetical protein
MNNHFQLKYLGLSTVFSACPSRFTKFLSCRIGNNELVKATLSPRTESQIDKIMRTRNRNRIKQNLVKWRGYDEAFNSWVNVPDIIKM